MGRDIRFIPEGGALVEVTCRTIQSRFLLRPSRQFNEIVVGALGRAKKLYPIDLVAFCALSNHQHLLAWVDNAEVLSRFMCHYNSKLAREVGLKWDWHDKIWARRYDALVISDEEQAQIGRLRYLLSNGVKEGLVERPEHWPGVHTAEAMTTRKKLKGYWFDRTKEYAARKRGENCTHYQHADREVLELSPLPCWRHLDEEERRERTKEMVEEIVEQGRIDRGDRPVKGRSAILKQSPYDSPNHSNHSPKPRFHAASKRKRKELEEAYSFFYAEFRDAADRLKAGERGVEFPVGSFPPAMPFVGSELSLVGGGWNGGGAGVMTSEAPEPRKLMESPSVLVNRVDGDRESSLPTSSPRRDHDRDPLRPP